MRSARQQYVERVLERYRHTPDTLAYIRRADRRLAAELYDRGVLLDTVEDALILATARRAFRPADATHLAPIASLHYFLPVILEITNTPPEPGYLDYLRHKLAPHTDHQRP